MIYALTRRIEQELEHSLEVEPLEVELRLDDAGGLDPGPEHVLLRGDVVRGGDAVQGVEVVRGRVVELVLAGAGEAVGHALVRPQAAHQLADLVRDLHLVALAGHLEEQAGVLLKNG